MSAPRAGTPGSEARRRLRAVDRRPGGPADRARAAGRGGGAAPPARRCDRPAWPRTARSRPPRAAGRGRRASCGNVAPPIETLRSSTVSGPSGVAISTRSASIRRRMRSATASSSARSYAIPSWPGSMITNSSPPNRPTRSLSRTSARSAAPTEESTVSPARCPCRSLTSLKWSRSRMSTAAPPSRVRAQHPRRPVLPGGGVQQARLGVRARDLLQVAHQHGPVQHDQRRQHQHRVQRALHRDRPGREGAHRQRRELEDHLVTPAQHLAERPVRRAEHDHADDEARVDRRVGQQRDDDGGQAGAGAERGGASPRT